jgi:general secretion pathway protein D
VIRWTKVFAAALLLSACASFPYELKKRPTASATPISVVDAAMDNTANAVAEEEPPVPARFLEPAKNTQKLTESVEDNKTKAGKPVIYAGSGRFLNDAGLTDDTTVDLGDDAVTLNFVEAPIAQAAKTIIGDILEANYVIEEGVEGTITLQTGSPIGRDALLSVLEAVLRPKGAAIIKERGLYRIVPLATALRGGAGLRLSQKADLPGFGVHIEPLRYVAAAEMARILEPIAPQGSILRVDQSRNLLMLAGTQYELGSLLETIQIFDVDWLSGMSFGVFPVKSTSPQAVIEELEIIFANETQGPLEGLVRFVPNERLNAVMTITAQPYLLRTAELWISRLDAAGADGAEQLYVYDVQNGSALELAEVLQNVLTGGKTASQRASPVAPNLDPVEITAQAGGVPQLQINSSPQMTEQGFSIGNGSPLVSGDQVKVYPYDNKNALVIVATPPDYASILGILEKLDVVSNQVLLEATIAEVALRDELNFGLQWFFAEGNHDITLSNASSGAIGSTFPGFSYVFSQADVRVALNALSSITDVNIVSSPSLMVLDNHTAVLQVGDQVPVATQSAVSITNPNAPIVNSVTFRDTGVILSLTPRVNESGVVLLEIELEVSDVVSTTTSGIDSPTIQQRRIQTTIAVQDGQSLALGGLIEDGVTATSSGVPFVSKVPVFGNLFKTRTDRKERTELLVLITPRVIRNMREAREVTDEFRRRLDAIAPLEERLN